VSVDPNTLVAAAQPGVPQPITFWISVTFNRPITSFGFRKGMVRTIRLCISFTVDTTVTVTGEMELSGGTLVVEPLGACAQLAEEISQAERALLDAQRAPEGPGSTETITALEKALAALQNQYNKYCGSGGSSGPSGPGGIVHLGGG
jgi:hypothetical protein